MFKTGDLGAGERRSPMKKRPARVARAHLFETVVRHTRFTGKGGKPFYVMGTYHNYFVFKRAAIPIKDSRYRLRSVLSLRPSMFWILRQVTPNIRAATTRRSGSHGTQ